MIDMFELLKNLVLKSEVVISVHGYEELEADELKVRDIVAGINSAEVLEYYPDFHKGPCILVLQQDTEKNPVHVVWGVSKGTKTPAVIVTAYRPNPAKWTNDFRRRKNESQKT